MIGIARSSAKLPGARAPTRDPFNFRKPHKGYTLRRPVRSAQEIRPRKVEKVKKKEQERSEESIEEGCGAETHTDACPSGVRAKQWRSGAGRGDER